ncbi:PC4 domain-containing protein [Lachancea thermotolerans]
MSYYNRYRDQRKFAGNGETGAAIDEPDAIFELGNNKRVTVRQFRNINLIDIREYYADSASGEMKPGKKGISLTEELYDELLKHRQNIDDALRRFGSKRPRTKTVNVLSDSEDEPQSMRVAPPQRSKPTRSEQSKPARRDRRTAAPAPPQSQPDEKRRKRDAREAGARLVMPGGQPSNPRLDDLHTSRTNVSNPRLDDLHTPPASASNPRLDDHLPRLPSVPKPDNDSDLDSSDEDFALALESEFQRDENSARANDHEDEGEISEES